MSSARETDGGRYLIIAGSPKAGTTSLFIYLRDHPDVCACRAKEPRFFMPADDIIGSRFCSERDPLEKYLALFECRDTSALRVEASPEYFYSPGTAERIHADLPHARIVVVLRDPISRLVSWYRFARFTREMDQDLDFDQFIQCQHEDTRPINQRPTWLRGLDTGRYAKYLAHYFEVIGRRNVLPIWFNDLEQDPRGVMTEVSSFCGIDPAFYAGYPFRRLNRTIEVEKPGILSAYTSARKTASRLLKPARNIRRALRRIRARVDPWVLRLSTRPAAEVSPSARTLEFLRDYYREDAVELAQLLNQPVPWAEDLKPKVQQ